MKTFSIVTIAKLTTNIILHTCYFSPTGTFGFTWFIEICQFFREAFPDHDSHKQGFGTVGIIYKPKEEYDKCQISGTNKVLLAPAAAPAPRSHRRRRLSLASAMTTASTSQVRQNYHQDSEAAINRQINLEL
ncbi:hypothetical protein H8959_018174 [Pygathrix nigripes]